MRNLPSAVITVLSVIALGFPASASSQMYRPEQSFPSGPERNLPLSRDAVEALNAELNEDFRALDAFSGGKRGIDRFPRGGESPGGWKLYGRFYLVNFKNDIDEEGGTRFTWRRTGPRIGGARIYIGAHRRF